MSRINGKTTLSEIMEWAEEDGFSVNRKQASSIKKAAENNCLLWSPRGIITCDDSRLEIRANA